MHLSNFVINLEIILAQKGMTYNCIAKNAGIKEDDIVNIINKQNLSYSNPNLLKIADALGCEIGYLLRGI